jgi:hypothetical protein
VPWSLWYTGDGKIERVECIVNESVLGKDFKEGLLGLKRFARMLQDLLDEEGLPIDVRIGVTPNGRIKQGIKELSNQIPEWIINEAKKLYYEELPG